MRTDVDTYFQRGNSPPNDTDFLVVQVMNLIAQLLPSGKCTIGNVAKTLKMHPRTLQRKLRVVDASYLDLLRETRRRVATRCLDESSIQVSDLAYNLGYAEVASFSRNFKSWTGLSPVEWRRTCQRAPE